MGWPFTGLKKKMVEKQGALDEVSPPIQVAPPMDDAAKEKAYQDEIKGIHLRMGYGTITKEQHDEGVKAINQKYGKE